MANRGAEADEDKRELAPRGGPEARGGRASGPPEDALGRVARDALDQAGEIVRDTASLGVMEAKRVVREVGPRVATRAAVGLVAAIAGATGLVLAVVALFDLLAGPVPSTAGRLAILAAGFAAIAIASGVVAWKGIKGATDEGPRMPIKRRGGGGVPKP
jgi:hypothetical protein